MKLLEDVAKARDRRLRARENQAKADAAFVAAVLRARDKGGHSWGEVAEAAGMQRANVRKFVLKAERGERNGES